MDEWLDENHDFWKLWQKKKPRKQNRELNRFTSILPLHWKFVRILNLGSVLE